MRGSFPISNDEERSAWRLTVHLCSGEALPIHVEAQGMFPAGKLLHSKATHAALLSLTLQLSTVDSHYKRL